MGSKIQHSIRNRGNASRPVSMLGLFFLVPLVLHLALSLGCDTKARFETQNRNFTHVALTGVTPRDAMYTAQCRGGDPSLLTVSAVMISDTPNPENSNGVGDYAIKPGQIIGTERIDSDVHFTPDAFDFTQVKIDGFAALKGSGQNSSISVSKVEFKYRPSEEESKLPLGIVILVDHSGSMSGALDFCLENNDSNFCERADCCTGPDDQLLDVPIETNVATPKNNFASDKDKRLIALGEFIEFLNDDDRAIIFTFNSTQTLDTGDADPDINWNGGERIGLDLACNYKLSQAKTPFKRLEKCFTDSKELLQDTIDLEIEPNTAIGRSTLWDAVAYAREFLNTKLAKGYSKQIIVLTDGPANCWDPDGSTICKGTPRKFRDDEIGSGVSIVGELDSSIPIHFIQWPSWISKTRDLNQVEASCLTGGEYIYVRDQDIEQDSTDHLIQQGEILGAMLLIRSMLRGTWLVHIALGDISGQNFQGGTDYAVEATLELKPQANLEIQDPIFDVNVNTKKWDRRLFVHKP